MHPSAAHAAVAWRTPAGMSGGRRRRQPVRSKSGRLRLLRYMPRPVSVCRRRVSRSLIPRFLLPPYSLLCAFLPPAPLKPLYLHLRLLTMGVEKPLAEVGAGDAEISVAVRADGRLRLHDASASRGLVLHGEAPRGGLLEGTCGGTPLISQKCRRLDTPPPQPSPTSGERRERQKNGGNVDDSSDDDDDDDDESDDDDDMPQLQEAPAPSRSAQSRASTSSRTCSAWSSTTRPSAASSAAATTASTGPWR